MGQTSIVRHLLEANKTILVLWSPVSLDSPVSSHAESSIVSVSEWRSSDGCHKNIVLIISLTQEFKHFRVLIVANSFENHVVSLLEGNVPDVLHGLHEWDSLPEGLLGLFLQVLGERMLVIDVISSPEVHAEHPRQEQLGETSVDEGTVVKDSRSPLLVEVTVLEHGRVGIKVLDSRCSVLACR